MSSPFSHLFLSFQAACSSNSSSPILINLLSLKNESDYCGVVPSGKTGRGVSVAVRTSLAIERPDDQYFFLSCNLSQNVLNDMQRDSRSLDDDRQSTREYDYVIINNFTRDWLIALLICIAVLFALVFCYNLFCSSCSCYCFDPALDPEHNSRRRRRRSQKRDFSPYH